MLTACISGGKVPVQLADAAPQAREGFTSGRARSAHTPPGREAWGEADYRIPSFNYHHILVFFRECKFLFIITLSLFFPPKSLLGLGEIPFAQ